MEKTTAPSKKLTRIVSAVLTVAFLGFIFGRASASMASMSSVGSPLSQSVAASVNWSLSTFMP